jgi:pimeloyl-ACP methyl ester carboxylesterase
VSKSVIGFAGMTHLGINSAAAAAGRGFDTICFDVDPAVITGLKAGSLPVVEPGLPELLAQNRQCIAYTADVDELKRCEVVYIAADVPTDDQGRSDLSGIRALIDTVTAGLRRDAILVILCQVPPGFTRSLPLPKERLYYQVETLVFGRAVERATKPERFIVGCADPRVTDLIGLGIPVNNTDFTYLRSCTKPKLFVQGANDEHGARTKVAELVAALPGENQLTVVDHADHFFAGHLHQLDQAITTWLVCRHPELAHS